MLGVVRIHKKDYVSIIVEKVVLRGVTVHGH